MIKFPNSTYLVPSDSGDPDLFIPNSRPFLATACHGLPKKFLQKMPWDALGFTPCFTMHDCTFPVKLGIQMKMKMHIKIQMKIQRRIQMKTHRVQKKTQLSTLS